MLLHRIYRHVAALILVSSCATVLHAQGSFDAVPSTVPSGTIAATATEITPTLGSPPAHLEFGAALAIHGHTVLVSQSLTRSSSACGESDEIENGVSHD